MSVRLLRPLVGIAIACLVAIGAMTGASPAGALAPGHGSTALLGRCLNIVLGDAGGGATPASGSADAGVVAQFGVFRRARSAVDRLPAAVSLRAALAVAGATSYDPSGSVLVKRTAGHVAVYAVPATVAPPTLPAACSVLPQFAGLGAELAVRALVTGTGPGACLISTQLVDNPPSGLLLPGARVPEPAKTLSVDDTMCASQAVLSGYVGALGDGYEGGAMRLALIPDGVSAITYTLPDGRRLTVPVAGNLATVPAALSIRASQRPTAAGLGRALAAGLPTTVTETGAGAAPVATLTQPVSLIPDSVATFSFLKKLLTSSLSVTGSSSTGAGSSGASWGASCSARTHRCVAVVVTTTCNSDGHCTTTRKIYRYRYVTAKPPIGTTGPDTQPTGPIVGRTNRLVTRPTPLMLVLSGTPHPHVTVLMSVSCFAHNSSAAGFGPPLQVAVPSRTPITLPGRVRSFQACDVGVLVISGRRGPVHVVVERRRAAL
jgi:hypothetical protein